MSRLLLLGCLAMLAGALHSSELKVTGTISDAAGKPVANADVSAWWSHWKGKLAPDGGVKSAADGSFSIDVDLEGSIPPTLLAYDSERKTGAILTLSKEPTQKVSLKFVPLAKVQARFDCPDMGLPFNNTIEGQLKALPAGSPFMQCGSETKESALLLPPGAYAFDNTSTDTVAKEYPFEVAPLATELDLGTVMLDPTTMSRRYGKTPEPLKLTDIRNAPKDLTLEKLKGKHVLVVFWALWCTPCVTGTLPDAIDFYDKHAALHNKFEIVGVHEPGVKTWEEYDAKAKGVIAKTWKGKDIKFPLALDATSFKDYGIKLMPAEMLIGPDGNVIPNGSLENLKKALGVE